MTRPARIAVRLYRLLLMAYPPAFRRAFAADIVIDFEDAWLQARRRSAWSVALFAVQLLADLAISMIREWGDTRLAYPAAAALSVCGLMWGGVAALEWPNAPPLRAGATLVAVVSSVALITVLVVVVRQGRPGSAPLLFRN